MSRFAVVVLLGTLNFSLVLAQDFRPGFILKTNGDSVSGFVDNRSAKKSAEACFFKLYRKGKREKYLPGELKGYGLLDDKYYLSKEVTIIRKEGRKKATLFVEVLVKGKASLYKYLDLFYLDKDSVFLLPKNVDEEVKVNERNYLRSTAKYIGILNVVLADCNLKANNTRYDERSLPLLIQNYNLCKGGGVTIYRAKKPFAKPVIGLLSGFDVSNITVGNNQYYNQNSFRKSASVPIGGRLDVGFPRAGDKVNLFFEVWYENRFIQGYAETQYTYLSRNDLFLKNSFLKFPVGIKFNLRHRGVAPYISVGFVQYLNLATSCRIVTEIEQNGVITTDQIDFKLDVKNPTGIWIGCGLDKRIGHRINSFAEMRYEKNDGFTKSSATGSAISFLIGLKF